MSGKRSIFPVIESKRFNRCTTIASGLRKRRLLHITCKGYACAALQLLSIINALLRSSFVEDGFAIMKPALFISDFEYLGISHISLLF